MDGLEIFQRENQRVTASDILQALASGQEIKLTGCTITGSVDVNRLFVKGEDFDVASLSSHCSDNLMSVAFDQALSFKSCVFEDDICFSALWESSEQLEVTFKRDVFFNMSEFRGQVLLGGAHFKAAAGFDGCAFERIAVWREAHFAKRAMFRTAAFKGYGIFSGTVFGGEARFTNTCFSKGGNFTGTEFQGSTDFSGCYSQGKAVPLYESVRFARQRYGADETFWRFIKQASQDAGYYRVSGECFYRERCAHIWSRFKGGRYDQLSTAQKVKQILYGVRLLPEVIFGKLLFGYGERPVRVLFVGLFIVLACGLFYSSSWAMLSDRAGDVMDGCDFGEGLYFSVTTFTTLGYGDISPANGHLLTRAVAMIEAISGAGLMAIFVVGLSKRYSRG